MDEEACCLNAAACFFFCSSMSANEAAIAAFSSASSASSGWVCDGLEFPFVAGAFDCDCSCDWGTYPELECLWTSSKLISNALFRSASKLSSTLAFRGSIDPWYSVLVGLAASNPLGTGVLRGFSVNFAWQPSSTRTGSIIPR